MNEINHSDFR